MLGFRSKRFGRDYGHVYATFNTSAHRLESTRGQDPKADDALYLLEILPMLHYTGFPAEIFKEAWQGYHNLGTELCDKAAHAGLQYIQSLERPDSGYSYDLLTFRNFDWGDRRFEKALKRLNDLALISKTGNENGTDLIFLHPLVHAWAKDRLDRQRQLKACLSAGYILALSTESSPGTLSLTSKTWLDFEQQLRPHVLSLVENEMSFEDPLQTQPLFVSKISYRIASILSAMGQHTKLESCLSHIFQRLDEDPYVPRDPGLLRLHKVKAQNLAALNKPAPSLDLWYKIQDLEHLRSPSDSLEQVISLQGIAKALWANGDRSNAIDTFRTVVFAQKMRLLKEHQEVLAAEDDLARAYLKAGQAQKAIGIFEHIVGINKTNLKENDPVFLSSQHKLAWAYYEAHDVWTSLKLFEYVLMKEKETEPTYHASIFLTQSWLSDVYLEVHRQADALRTLEDMVATIQNNCPNFDKQLPVVERRLENVRRPIPWRRRVLWKMIQFASKPQTSLVGSCGTLRSREFESDCHLKPLRSQNRTWTSLSWNSSRPSSPEANRRSRE